MAVIDPALRQIPLFQNYDDKGPVLEKAGDLAAMLTNLEEGDVLFREGDPPRGLYVLVEGTLEITKRIGNSDVILANHGPGAFVGETSSIRTFLRICANTARLKKCMTPSTSSTRPILVLKNSMELRRSCGLAP